MAQVQAYRQPQGQVTGMQANRGIKVQDVYRGYGEREKGRREIERRWHS